MSCRRFGFGFVLAIVLACSFGIAVADDEGDGNGHAVTAEVEPGHEGESHAGDGAHAAGADDHGGHVDHQPYETALHGNAGPGQDKPEEWRMSLAIWTLVVFGCLVAVLWKFAWGPLCTLLDERESGIQSNIDAAKELNVKAAALLADHEARLAGTADEVRGILDDARRDAETQKQSILAEAEAAAEAQKTRALQEIDAAKNGALQELAEKSVDTAVGLAGKIVQRQLSPDDHASLISEAIKHFPSKN